MLTSVLSSYVKLKQLFERPSHPTRMGVPSTAEGPHPLISPLKLRPCPALVRAPNLIHSKPLKAAITPLESILTGCPHLHKNKPLQVLCHQHLRVFSSQPLRIQHLHEIPGGGGTAITLDSRDGGRCPIASDAPSHRGFGKHRTDQFCPTERRIGIQPVPLPLHESPGFQYLGNHWPSFDISNHGNPLPTLGCTLLTRVRALLGASPMRVRALLGACRIEARRNDV